MGGQRAVNRLRGASDGKPANAVSTDPAPAWPPRPGRCPQASACAPYREVIAEACRLLLHALAYDLLHLFRQRL